LSEILYVASRIYQAAKIDEPNNKALDFIEWVKNKVKIVNVNESIALRAGEIKKQFRLALPDCYVIATAEDMDAKPLFRKIEEEMKPVLGELRRLGVEFLEEMQL